jgi:hypothetical protein
MLTLFALNQKTRGIRRFCLVLFIISGLFLTACASQPPLPMPKDENDTLLIIRLGQRKAPGADTVSVIELKIDTLDEPIILKPWVPYTVVRGLTPGEHKTMTITFVPYTSSSHWYTTGGNQKPQPQTFSVPFVMKAGECTIFPVKFVYIMEIDSVSGAGRIRWDFKEFSEEDIRNETEGMKKMENFTYWQPETGGLRHPR